MLPSLSASVSFAVNAVSKSLWLNGACGIKLLPSQTKASPLVGGVVVVSTSLSTSMLLSAIAVSKSL